MLHGERPYWWVEEPSNIRYLKGSVVTHSPQSRYLIKLNKNNKKMKCVKDDQNRRNLIAKNHLWQYSSVSVIFTTPLELVKLDPETLLDML